MASSSETSPLPKPEDGSPQLPALVLTPHHVDDVEYPAAGEVDSLGALDDWIALIDDALTEARNGVNAITWPLTVASLVGVLTLAADVFEGAADFLAAVTAHPGKSAVGLFLAAVAVAAFCLSNQVTEKRRKLSAIRRAYIRRRRELSGRVGSA